MKTKPAGYRRTALVYFVFAFMFAASATSGNAQQQNPKERNRGGRDNNAVSDSPKSSGSGVIAIPGAPVESSDIAWADPATRRFYFSDRSNSAIDIVDAVNHKFAGRVTGFTGAEGRNGRGPNGVVVTPEKKAWAGDGNATVRVADVNPISPTYLHIVKSIDVSIPACGSNCDRADEIGYDPAGHKILIAIDQPKSAADPAKPIPAYAAIIDAKTYKVTHIVQIEGIVPGKGLEQPLWDAAIGRFFLTVPSSTANGGNGEIAVINPKSGKVEKSYSPGNCRPGGEVLTKSQQIVVRCGDAAVILNALNGNVIGSVPKISADELWYNTGNNRVYAAGDGKTLQIVDPDKGVMVEAVPDLGARNLAALATNNTVFTPVRVTAGQAANPETDTTVCAQHGLKGTGCVAFFSQPKSGTAAGKTD